jgi:hypothetical protein
MPMTRAHALALSLFVCACGTGEDTDGSGSTPATGVTSASASTSSASTGEGSTSQDATSDSTEPTTAEPTSGTTAEPTTGDASTGDTTGPACDPGTEGCPCDGGLCDEGLVCDADMCVPGLACDDATEPDDDEPSAHDLGEITDDDDETVMADGVLSGAADVDWYVYKGIDTFGHVSEPTIQVASSATVRVCQFLECEEGAVMTTVECPEGTQSALSGMLRPGCCGGAMFTVSSFECPGTNDNLFVYVRIDKASKDSCVEYSLKAHD